MRRLVVLEQESAGRQDTSELISRAQAGERQAYQVLVERHQRLVAMIVFRLVPSREDALDLCQEVFLKAYEKLGSFRSASGFGTWIGRIAHNCAINHLKKKRMPSFAELRRGDGGELDVVDGSVGPEGRCLESERQSALERGLGLLTKEDRTMVVLFHQEGMGYEEIAQLLELTLSQVKSHLFRARKRLRESLAERIPKQEVS